jgi:transposase
MGNRFSEQEKALAVSLFVEENLSLRAVAERVGCSVSTLRGWLAKAGVNPAEVARDRGRHEAQTEAATAARLAKHKQQRNELVDLLRESLTLRTASMIAAKLARAEEDEELVKVARDRWRDALAVEAQAADFGPAEQKAARKAAMAAKVDVLIAESAVPTLNELSMVLNRAVRDLLAIEGYDHELAEEDADGRLTVVITSPRPDRGNVEVIQLGAPT